MFSNGNLNIGKSDEPFKNTYFYKLESTASILALDNSDVAQLEELWKIINEVFPIPLN